MKRLTHAFYVLAPLILVLTLWGCGKTPENPVTDIPVNGTVKMIRVEQNGVEITFCLLNEQGEPATIFSQGENFRFHLAIKNRVQKDTALYIVSSFLSNPDLFQVYDENGISEGKPWKLSKCSYISDGVNELKRGEEWTMESPWQENDSVESHFLQCYFQGLDQPLLPSGKYYTAFTQQFCLGRYFHYEDYSDTPYEFMCTDTLTFKINFEIK